MVTLVHCHDTYVFFFSYVNVLSLFCAIQFIAPRYFTEGSWRLWQELERRFQLVEPHRLCF